MQTRYKAIHALMWVVVQHLAGLSQARRMLQRAQLLLTSSIQECALTPESCVTSQSEQSLEVEAERTGLCDLLPSERFSGIVRNGEMHFGFFLLLCRDKEAETWGCLRDLAQVLHSRIKKGMLEVGALSTSSSLGTNPAWLMCGVKTVQAPS